MSENDKTPEEKAKQAAVEQQLREALEGLGIRPGADGKFDMKGADAEALKNQLPAMMLQLFATALAAGAPGANAAPAAPSEEPQVRAGLRLVPAEGDNAGGEAPPSGDAHGAPDPAESGEDAAGPVDNDAPATPTGDTDGAAADAGASEVVDLAAERAKRTGGKTPSPFEAKIQGDLRGAFNDYITSNVSAEPGSEVNVDAEFVREHGPKLVTTMLTAFAKALIPPEIQVEIPQKDDKPAAPASAAPAEGSASAPDADPGAPAVAPKPPQMKLKIDFGKIFAGLVNSAKKAEAEAGDAARDEPKPE